MIIVSTQSVDETRALGTALAGVVQSGDVLVLAGDLGAGKTALAQGLGKGLGVDEPIISPTFTLARHYDGRLCFHHLDVYRLEQMEEVFDMGLPELLDDGGTTVIEWGDAVAPVLPADYLEIRLSLGDADDHRTLSFQPVGRPWGERMEDVAAVVEPWAPWSRSARNARDTAC